MVTVKRDFDTWLSNFKTSIADYDYYVDFEKIYKKVNEHKIALGILGTLIGSTDIENEFENIILNYPETLECIPLLLAVRSKEIFVKEEISEYLFNFNTLVYSIQDYKKFMRESGLFNLLEHHIINNLYDYALGIEVGLDSNGRKNRGGHLMENLVEKYIVNAGYIKNVSYFKEMYIEEIEKRWNVDLSKISGNNTSTKRFDFVIKTDNQIYLVETNFFTSSGTKLNETARSYELIARDVKEIDGVTFIWITDGVGWKNVKYNLQETFNVLDTLYNIHDLENGVLNNLK